MNQSAQFGAANESTQVQLSTHDGAPQGCSKPQTIDDRLGIEDLSQF